MTLKDRFLEILEVTDRNFQNEDAECFKKIADDYAIEFAYWITDSENNNVKGSISIEKLLEIFKKENKL